MFHRYLRHLLVPCLALEMNVWICIPRWITRLHFQIRHNGDNKLVICAFKIPSSCARELMDVMMALTTVKMITAAQLAEKGTTKRVVIYWRFEAYRKLIKTPELGWRGRTSVPAVDLLKHPICRLWKTPFRRSKKQLSVAGTPRDETRCVWQKFQV